MHMYDHIDNWTAYITEISIETSNTAQTSSYTPLVVDLECKCGCVYR